MQLPVELSEQVLLQADPSTLVSLCGTSLQYRSICSGPSFWRIRFEQEGLPLLEEGSNAQEWIGIYQKAHRVAQLVEGYLEGEGERISFQQINLDELAKLAPWLTEAYINHQQQTQELLRQGQILEEEDAPKDLLDDIDAALAIIPEYSLILRHEGNTYALDALFHTPIERDYDYSTIVNNLTSDEAFDMLFTLLY
ncbi:F-box domain-containing protein [Brazilian cedratvirus IHUMI]|uniref:F-box domain-containing protein n=1 Tax=Brazilian cedratvirus IHUMI TaxID=2126980 RepID=A0A2R8FE34_9VIRU|nr:F-box domain-containing protein [Brazilian cedratvirus IHUMI]